MEVDSKNTLRSHVRSIVAEVDAVEALRNLIQSWSVYQKAKRIAIYIAMADEVSLEFLGDSGKQVFLPRFVEDSGRYEMALLENKNQLEAGKYGIKEPGKKCRASCKDEIDLWFIPGMAFDKQGHRLGRGAGFYDRLLAGEGGIKAGVCSSERMLEGIPLEEHDVRMDFVLTDKEIIQIK